MSIAPTADPSARTSGRRASRRRSAIIAALRLVLPAVSALVLLSVLAALAVSALGDRNQPAPSTRPIELVAPRLVGADDKGRPFVITAAGATRDGAAAERVGLDRPQLVLDEGGPDYMRVTAAKGVFDERDGKLSLSGGVKLVGPQGAYDSPATVFDTRTGEIAGSGAVRGAGAFGDIQAGSYAVKDKGDRIIFKGRVHSRQNLK